MRAGHRVQALGEHARRVSVVVEDVRHDGERVDGGQRVATAARVGEREAGSLLHQSERLETLARVVGTVDELPDADDDGAS